MRRRIGAVLILLGLALAIPAAPATAAVPAGLEYVSLGDSYSAGFGLPDINPNEPALGCYQSLHNWPQQVAAALNLTLTDRTCSGAVTANIIATPQPTIGNQGIAPPQSNYLSATTDIVTVTIGGNDLGFGDVAAKCIALTANGPVFLGFLTNCKDYYNANPAIDLLVDLLDDTVKPALAAAFADIKLKAPNARVFVVGYPSIAPNFANIPSGGCFSNVLGSPNDFLPPFPENAFPYTQTDTLYLHKIEGLMDDAAEAAGLVQGFTFVPTWDATQAHSACATVAPFVYGITLTNVAADGTATPINNVYSKLGNLHPNPAGAKFMAEQVIAAIKGHPDFAEAAPAPTLPNSGTNPLLLVGISIAMVGLGLVAIRRRASKPAARL